MREGRELQNGVTERPSASAPGGRGGDGAHPPLRVRPYPQPVASALAPELNFKMPIGGTSEEREEHKPEEEERGEEEEEEEEFLSRGRTGERTDVFGGLLMWALGVTETENGRIAWDPCHNTHCR